MKTKSKISGHIIRGGAWAVFLSVAFIAATSGFDSPNKWYKSALATVGYGSTAKSPSQSRTFSFAERVAYQRAIEDVYWRHRILGNALLVTQSSTRLQRAFSKWTVKPGWRGSRLAWLPKRVPNRQGV
jgi:hypothetical protein